MSIRSHVEWVEIWRLSPGEKELVRRAYKFKSDKVKIQVIYTDRAVFTGGMNLSDTGCFFTAHETGCPAREAPYSYVTCACRDPVNGNFATRRVYGKGQKAVLFRFVPRPLTLEQAIEYEELDADGKQFARVTADMLLEKGDRRGEQLALKIHRFALPLLAIVCGVLISCSGRDVSNLPQTVCGMYIDIGPVRPDSTAIVPGDASHVRHIENLVKAEFQHSLDPRLHDVCASVKDYVVELRDVVWNIELDKEVGGQCDCWARTIQVNDLLHLPHEMAHAAQKCDDASHEHAGWSVKVSRADGGVENIGAVQPQLTAVREILELDHYAVILADRASRDAGIDAGRDGGT